ncbi:MAG: hypothetical protein MUO19_05070 [Dehalococcoidales bacterium]|nr:hypothetical protein [Dehalococcoidales bacterium]
MNDNQIHRLDIPCELDAAELIKRMRIPRGNDRLRESVKEMTEHALKAARPKALYRTASVRVIDRDTVEVEGICLTSRALSKNLEDQETVFPFVTTIGRELDELPLPPGSMMLKFYLDTVKTMVLVTAVDYLAAHIKATHGLAGSAHMNPGEIEDWPITEQKPLFSVFGGVEKDIGLELKESGIMKPVKSRSGIIFPNETGFLSCFLCTQKHCPGRKARYDTEKVKEYLE